MMGGFGCPKNKKMRKLFARENFVPTILLRKTATIIWNDVIRPTGIWFPEMWPPELLKNVAMPGLVSIKPGKLFFSILQVQLNVMEKKKHMPQEFKILRKLKLSH